MLLRADTSVVAFATGVHGGLGHAMKFFAVRAAFDAEVALYHSRALGPLAPIIDAVYDPDVTPDALSDRFGRALPPCIVMERGESLNEWSRRAKPDVFQAVAVRPSPPAIWCSRCLALCSRLHMPLDADLCPPALRGGHCASCMPCWRGVIA